MPDDAPAYAAVDLGASSGRVLTGRLVGGRLVAEETGRFTNRPVVLPDDAGGTLHWDVLGLWSGVLDGLAAASRTGPLAGVGVDTWAVDYGLLDERGALLANPVAYRDERTTGVPERFFAAFGADRHYATTGVQVQPFNTVFQLLAERRLASAHQLLLLPDLLTRWLGGEPVAEVTNASTTGLLDVRTRTWDADVVAAVSRLAGNDVGALLPGLVEPGAPVGRLRPELGLGDGRLVAVGSHDTASAIAATPMADPEHAAYISSGTWSLVGVELPTPVLTPEARAANFTNEIGVAGTVRFLRNVAGLWLLSECQRAWSAAGQAHDLSWLLRAAADVPACRTVVDVDDPVFVAPGDMPRRIAEVARATGQPVPEDPASTTRCVLDSLALAYRRAVRTVADLTGRDVRVVHVVGGGSRNELLCRLTADATGLPVVAGPAEGTAMGNLLVQAWATGELSGGLPRIRDVVVASSNLRRWDPSGDTRAWDRAETLLRDVPVARP